MDTTGETTLSRGTTKAVDVQVGDIKVKVKTDVTPASLKLIRDLVDTRFEDFAGKLSKGKSSAQLMAMVALSLAEEVLDERERIKVLKRQVLERSDRLLSRVEAHLDRDS